MLILGLDAQNRKTRILQNIDTDTLVTYGTGDILYDTDADNADTDNTQLLGNQPRLTYLSLSALFWVCIT